MSAGPIPRRAGSGGVGWAEASAGAPSEKSVASQRAGHASRVESVSRDLVMTSRIVWPCVGGAVCRGVGNPWATCGNEWSRCDPRKDSHGVAARVCPPPGLTREWSARHDSPVWCRTTDLSCPRNLKRGRKENHHPRRIRRSRKDDLRPGVSATGSRLPDIRQRGPDCGGPVPLPSRCRGNPFGPGHAFRNPPTRARRKKLCLRDHTVRSWLRQENPQQACRRISRQELSFPPQRRSGTTALPASPGATPAAAPLNSRSPSLSENFSQSENMNYRTCTMPNLPARLDAATTTPLPRHSRPGRTRRPLCGRGILHRPTLQSSHPPGLHSLAAGLPAIITPHSFRTMVVTDLLSQGVSTEHVQYLVGHARPSTTQLYDRRAKRVTRNIVERISV